MLRTTSQVVQPMPYADSFSTGGTTSNTSRITDAMNGITMIASTKPAVSTPMPCGGPLNNAPIAGVMPSVLINHGCTWSANSGARTNRPHMP